MRPAGPPPLQREAEIAALIETLHATDRRLQVLTQGEVDGVADEGGRTILLRHAQDRLRRGDAERQSAILNALPAHIALLDPQGVIVAVNAAWEKFARENALTVPEYAIGANYLELCDGASGPDSAEAKPVAAGIRKVLEGRARAFSIEYPCHSATEHRWFLLSVSPLAEGRQSGAVVMHLDVSERTLRDEELRRFRAAMDLSGDAILLVDRKTLRYVDVNQTMCTLTGYTRAELLGMTPMDLFNADRATIERDYDAIIADPDSNAARVNGEYLRKDGSVVAIETRRGALRTEDGWVIFGIAREVTEKRAAEAKILRLNRVYAVLSGINGAIVRIRDRGELFREVCRIAVEEGGFTLARVVELDAAGRARLAATSESESSQFQSLLDQHNANPERSSSVIALVLASGEAVISNDVAADLRLPNRAALTRDGNYALALLPIFVEKRIAGLILLRARKAGAFTLDELHLLQEMTDNISLSLEHMEKEDRLTRLAAEKQRGEEALLRFADAMDATADAIYLVDRASMKLVHVNNAACAMQGLSREELLALGPEGVLSVDRAELERTYDALIARGGAAAPAELLRSRRDGSQAWIELRRHARRTADGWMIVSVVRDISERKRAEGEALAGTLEKQRLADQLGEERSRLVEAQQVAKIGSWETDLATRAVIWSAQTHRIYETDPAAFVPTHAAFLAHVHPEDRARVDEAFSQSVSQRGTSTLQHRVLLPNGRVKHVEERWKMIFDADRTAVRAIGTSQDITDRKEAEERIAALDRVRAVLSGINALIVRARDRDDLFREACRVAVEAGGFQMAWIGIVDRPAGKVVPIAVEGAAAGFLEQIRDLFPLRADAGVAETMSARAVRTQRPVVYNDIRLAAPFQLVRERLAQGILSIAVLPLLVEDEAEGVLVLYSREKDFFHGEEMKLLRELAGDIAFAVDHIGKQARLEYLAYHDVLTGLANRALFLKRVGQYVRGAAAEGGELAVFLVDLERFRNINDSLGRPAGDALLRRVAEWLVLNTGDAGLVARLGADEFAVVVPRVKPGGDVARLLEKWLAAFLDHPFDADGTRLRVSARVGVAQFPKDGEAADALLKNAEAALKIAKARGERYLFHTQKMTEGAAGKLTLENQLRQALENEEFVLHYQPKISLASGTLTSAEALIRWNDPRTGLVPPGRFIPVLEETGLIYEVGRWALRKAIDDYLRWRAAGLPAVRLAVNVSPLQLRNRGFVEEIRQRIAIDVHAAGGLELEITESLIMEDVQHSIASLEAIRAMNVTVAIDDFGTGYSSLSYLAKLPVDSLKIDRSFVTAMTASPEGLSLVSTIINLAHSLRLKVVAEGVETDEQQRLLRLLGCDEMQGFLFSRPVPAQDFEARFLAPQPVPQAK